ncbi:MAG: hypothetical protein JW838_14970 [Spirochaetes bacterium]|nr:hypothetical protein [Spirochaetota bacterium]
MESILLWSYLLNLVFLILHEIDGAYWKEWRFFGDFGRSLSDATGLAVYLWAHVPIFIILLYGLVSLDSLPGRILSIIFSGFMICHFFLHVLFKKKGHEGFEPLASRLIFTGTLALSALQFTATILLLAE